MNVKELNSIWQLRLGGLSFGDAGLLSYLISWRYDEKQNNPARLRRPLPQGALIHQVGMNSDCGPMFNNNKSMFVTDGPAPFVLTLADGQVGKEDFHALLLPIKRCVIASFAECWRECLLIYNPTGFASGFADLEDVQTMKMQFAEFDLQLANGGLPLKVISIYVSTLPCQAENAPLLESCR